MERERPLLGCLGALLFGLLTAPLAWWLSSSQMFTGLAGVTGFLLALGGYKLLGRRLSGLAVGLSALLPPLLALPGIYYAWAEQILADNARYGCTLEEALEMVPQVAMDPFNHEALLWDLGGLAALDLVCAYCAAVYLRRR